MRPDQKAAASAAEVAVTAILGISAFYHDSAAALVVDGEIVAAAQEERFTRKKHDPGLPAQAIDFCLSTAGIRPEDLDYVGFYDKPLLKFDRLLQTWLATAPQGLIAFSSALPAWLTQKLHLRRQLRKALPGYQRRFVFAEHHESHAASAFFPSPFEEAAVLTVDGVGEWATASFGTGTGNRLELTQELRFPHSLGLLYSAFTSHCGFKVNSGEHKLMGLAPYGEPKYSRQILQHLIDLKPDGSFRMDMKYFRYCRGLKMTSPAFAALFDGPARQPEAPLTQRECDLAASVQQVTEEILLRMVRHVHAQTGQQQLCLAGGVALNCVANGRILHEGPFDSIWVQPAAGDAGGSLGVALFVWHQLLGHPRVVSPHDGMQGSRLGPAASEQEITSCLARQGAVFRQIANEEELCRETARLIAHGNVVGWFQGRMEFGPRALGGRSLLGDARNAQLSVEMNRNTKFREAFRPLAPAVLQERVSDYFDFPADTESPYMMLVAPVAAAQQLPLGDRQSGLDAWQQIRSRIPAVTHVDMSARLQTVDAQRCPRFHRLLQELDKQTGCAVVVNTSFNIRGEPIVCTPEEAYRCFLSTNMDALVIENFLLLKSEQPAPQQQDRDHYLKGFDPD